jgi:hypothetical protein
LPTKFPLLLARRQARARLLREYSILSGESSLTFFLFGIYRATCLCGPFRSSEINLLPGARDLLIRRNLVDGVLYRLRVENLSAPFQLRLGRILVQTLGLVTQSK